MGDLEKAMIIIRSGPGDGPKAGEGLRLSAAMIGMDRIPVLAFVDDGVECLLPDVFDDVGRDYLRTAADLAGIRVLEESLIEHGIQPSDLWSSLVVKTIGMTELAELVASSDMVAAF